MKRRLDDTTAAPAARNPQHTPASSATETGKWSKKNSLTYRLNSTSNSQPNNNNNNNNSHYSHSYNTSKTYYNLTPTPESSTPRPYTVSVAISATMLASLDKPELRTYVAGQIGRSLALMEVDEVIVYADAPVSNGVEVKTTAGAFESAAKKNMDPKLFLARILQYLEAPAYLRKALFPVHRDLQYAGLMNPLETPHHMRIDDQSLYREGVTLGTRTTPGTTLVDCGTRKPVLLPVSLPPHIRVTCKLDLNTPASSPHISASAVSPSTPREEHGLYWGYTVRLAGTISEIIGECPWKEGYDVTVGISDKAKDVGDVMAEKGGLSGFKHLLVVMGGAKGIEYSVGCDEALKVGEDECEQLFDFYVNPLVGQGSRSLRIEESLLVAMTALRPHILKNNKSV